MINNYIYDLEKDKIYPELNAINTSDYLKTNFYDCYEFHDYHQKFADEVFRLGVVSNGKIIGYCYLGRKDNIFKIPYSSPFSLIHLKENFKTDDALNFIEGIKRYANKMKIKEINITLPPDIYGRELINVLGASLFSQGFRIKSIDINNYFDLSNFEDIDEHIKNSIHKIRKNYKRAIKNNLEFEELSLDDFEVAYDVIKINREQMGYPLKISKSQMQDIINMDNLTARLFVVNKDTIPIAAAIIFDVTNDISQVVYWGDIPEYRNERVMDFMPIKIFDIYKGLGKKYLDIGPSSEDGIINTGLAGFKRALGCNSNIKITYEYNLT